MNSLDSFTGRPAGSDYNAIPTWTNNDVGNIGDTLHDRDEALTARFNNVSGHAHSGVAGDGAPINAANLSSVPLRGYVIQGIDQIGVTGSSTDVTASLLGKAASSGPTSVGVVVTVPNNKTIIRQATGPNENDSFVDGLGNTVFARLTESGGTWTLSYYVNISGVETAYSFAGASDVRWYYQELFNPMVNPPVYSEFAFTPSDNTTADVETATTTLQGKVQLASAPAASVGSSSSAGTPNATVANADHVHQGVHSFAEFVDSTQVFGDLVLKGLGSVTITRVGNTFEFSAGGGLVPVQEIPTGICDGANTTFGLSNTPYSFDSVLVFVDGVERTKGTAWTLVGTDIVFQAGYIPPLASQVEVYYVKQGAILTGILTPKTEYRTLTPGEATAKALTLNHTPSTSSEVTLDVIGGGPQFYGDDFTVSGNSLSWNSLALDGVLSSGDRLRIGYFY